MNCDLIQNSQNQDCSSPCNNQYQAVDYSKCITPPSPLKDFKELQLPPLGETFPTVGEAEKQAKLAAERKKSLQNSSDCICICNNVTNLEDIETYNPDGCGCNCGDPVMNGKSSIEESYDQPDLIRTTSGNVIINRVFFQDRVCQLATRKLNQSKLYFLFKNCQYYLLSFHFLIVTFSKVVV